MEKTALGKSEQIATSNSSVEQFTVYDQGKVTICGPVSSQGSVKKILCLLCNKPIDNRAQNLKRHMKCTHKIGDAEYSGFIDNL